MQSYLILFLFLTLQLSLNGQPSFKKEQLKNSRVRTAFSEKWIGLKSKLHQDGVDTTSFQICILVFKKEKVLELWIKSKKDSGFIHKLSYDICASSGDPGPKRMQGDGQVPEGFYQVSVFNPYSRFYLSLGLNYPNKSDRIIIGKGNPGGDIMIHGNCVTIGCVPLTDDKIKEVYVLAVEAMKSGQQQIPVYLFPARMDATGMKWLSSTTQEKALYGFWANLKLGYDYFEQHKNLPVITVGENGRYIFR